MSEKLPTLIWSQFGAALDMFEKGMLAAPEKVWGDRNLRPEFWYVVSHTLFWLDYYATDSPETFAPPAPFGLEELDPAGVLPPRVYSQQELKTYLDYGRAKVKSALATLTESAAALPCRTRPGMSAAELWLYSLRHVQHHAAQLYLLLRQTTDSAPNWVGRSAVPLQNE